MAGVREVRVPRRFVTPSDRHVFLAVGAWAVVMAVFMFLDSSGPKRVWGYPMWGVLLLIGGLLTFAFAIRMASFRLRGYAAGMMVVGCVGLFSFCLFPHSIPPEIYTLNWQKRGEMLNRSQRGGRGAAGAGRPSQAA